MKEDLVKNFEYQKSDSSMKASSEDENQFNCLAGESQELEDPEEIPLEDIFEEIKNTVSRRISKGESSNLNEDMHEYHQSPYKEKIIFLEYQDVILVTSYV
uniref:Uncharacterized protein n=1 Tax=Tanacetum cinerariifolium TaxID=118510 RepID=A0A699KMA4_TANCI|nr:hypothetical protein [Tanacetum cinerariifolium]